MAATLGWRNSTGAVESWSSITQLRFKAADNNTNDTADPIVIPSSGTAYSYEKWLLVYVESGTFTELSNLRVLTSADVPTINPGVTLQYRFTSTYSAPVGTNMTETGSLSTTEVVWSNAGTHTSGTAVKWTGSDYLVLQLDVASTATAGELTTWNLIARYDEI